MDSILSSIKDSLGIDESDKGFDNEIKPLINRTFLSLMQLGIKPIGAPRITSELDTWNDKFGERDDLDAIQTYVYLKVRLVFDPPTNSSVIEVIKEDIKELEWRLNANVETPDKEVVE